MIQLSEATAIAIHAMIYLANSDQKQPHSLKEIASVFCVSENHLSKVLQKLVKAGYIISTKGPKGGFLLLTGNENLTLMEIYETIEGKYHPKDCLFASKHITSCCCIMKPMIQSINNTFENFMNNNKISDLRL